MQNVITAKQLLAFCSFIFALMPLCKKTRRYDGKM